MIGLGLVLTGFLVVRVVSNDSLWDGLNQKCRLRREDEMRRQIALAQSRRKYRPCGFYEG